MSFPEFSSLVMAGDNSEESTVDFNIALVCCRHPEVYLQQIRHRQTQF